MEPEDERLLRAVTSFAKPNAELEFLCRNRFSEFVHLGGTREEKLLAAERIERSRSKLRIRIWSVAVLGLVALVAAIPFWRQWSQVALTQELTNLVASVDEIDVSALSLSRKEQLVLFGDREAPDLSSTWKALWDLDKGHPGYFQEYAFAYQQQYDRLPPDFVRTGAEIDPGNGFYRLVDALEGMRDLIDVASGTGGGGVAAMIQIRDEEEFKKRLDSIYQALAYSRLNSATDDLIAERLHILAEPEGFVDWARSGLILATQNMGGVKSRMLLPRVFSAEAQRCQRMGDREGFDRLVQSWQRAMGWMLDDGSTAIDALIVRVAMAGSLPAMRDAAVALDSHGDEWSALELEVRHWHDKGRAARKVDPVMVRHGSMMSNLSLPPLQNVAAGELNLERDDLRPFCRVEQAYVLQIVVTALVFVGLAVWSISVAVVVLSGMVTRHLVSSFQSLLTWRDWSWIGIGGVGLPLLLYGLIRYATPWGRLDWGPKTTFYLVPVGQLVALGVMIWTWSVVIAAWRFHRSVSIGRWHLGRRIWLGAAMLLPILSMVLLGMALPMGPMSLVLASLAALALLGSFLWLLLRLGWGGQRGEPWRKIQRVAVLSTAQPAWLGAVLVFVTLFFFFQAEERRWLKQDKVMTFGVGFANYEEQVSNYSKEVLRQILADHPVD
ncbi:MAG: hypothetical protein ACQKBU_00225 [Verrucomicrobiales bacterium]